MRRFGPGTMAALAFTVAVWSTTFAGMIAALRHFTPDQLLFLRWMATCLVLGAYGALVGVRFPAKRDIPQIVLAGLLGVGFYQYALVHGQAGVSASVAAFIVNMSPVFTLLLSVVFFGERTTPFTWAGLAVSVGGVVLMGVGKGGFAEGGSLASAGLVALATLSYGGYSLAIRPLLARYRPIEVTLYAIVAGTLPFAFLFRGVLPALASATAADVGVLIYLSVVPGAIAFVLWSRIVHTMKPALASRFLYFIPVLAMVVAWVWLGEVPAAVTVAGGLVTVAGVALAAVQRVPRFPLPRSPHGVVVRSGVESATDAA